MIPTTNEEFSKLKNKLKAISRNDNFYSVDNEKYVERHLVYFDKDGKRIFGAHYDVLAQHHDQCYGQEWYFSQDYFEAVEYYEQIPVVTGKGLE